MINWLNSPGKGERSFFIRQALRKAIMEVKEDKRPHSWEPRVENEVPVREIRVMNIPEEPNPDEQFHAAANDQFFNRSRLYRLATGFYH